MKVDKGQIWFMMVGESFIRVDESSCDSTRQDKTRQDNIYSHFLFHRITVTKK